MSEAQDLAPVIAVDGGAGVGKGSASMGVANILKWHRIDSGMLYRAVGKLSDETNATKESDTILLARTLDFRVEDEKYFLNGVDRAQDLRSDIAGKRASQVSQIPEVRRALRDFQLSARRSPGLVADGRDQGEVFEHSYRYFLIANTAVKAKRRMFQLEQLGIPFNSRDVHDEIVRRDHADTHRDVSPLRPLPDAVVVDTSFLNRDEVVDIIIRDYKKRSKL